MKRFLFLFVMLMIVSVFPCEAQEEREAPGFSDCLNNAETTSDMHECLRMSTEYWDAELNRNYKRQMQLCRENSDDAQCAEKLKKAERLWIQYRDAMRDAIGAMNGGTMAGLLAGDFFNSETKKQALLLEPSE